MNDRFEATNIDEVDEVLKHFNHFHDDHVAGIEIKFENYKALDDDDASTGIRNADKTVILTVNTYPYRKAHNQFVHVEFKDVQSFEMLSPLADHGPKGGPTWGTLNTCTMPEPVPDGTDIKWEFEFICGGTKFLVICSKIVFLKQVS
ncbi:hypothetical protein C6499_02685 [Candidatus Poribacteria bacterium]|nr:MAG: hypothetical protein C6499_02685 [Candidatus Poribacteria bacterium]